MNDRMIGVYYDTGPEEYIGYIINHKEGLVEKIDMSFTNGKSGGLAVWARTDKDDPASAAKGNLTEAWKDLGAERPMAYRDIKCLMSSAILAKSGSQTGELLMAYPNTAFTNVGRANACCIIFATLCQADQLTHCALQDNTSPEMFKLQLRVYLGACLYQPEASTFKRNVPAPRRSVPPLTHTLFAGRM